MTDNPVTAGRDRAAARCRRSPVAPSRLPPQPRPPPPRRPSDRISIDDFMKVELRVAKVLTAERVREVEEAAEAVGGRRHRAAHARRRHRRGLRARGARRQDGRHRLQPEAGEADGDRVERDGARREPRRRQADRRLVRGPAGPRARECGDRRRRAAGELGGGGRARGAARSCRGACRRAPRRGGDGGVLRVDPQSTRRCCSRSSRRCRRAATSTTISRAPIYAESYLRWAADDGLCVATATMSIVGGTVRRERRAAARGRRRAQRRAVQPGDRRDVDAALGPVAERPRSFLRDVRQVRRRVARRTGDMLAEVAARAAAEHVSYLELMVTPDGGAGAARGIAAGWDPDFAEAARHAARRRLPRRGRRAPPATGSMRRRRASASC